MKCSVCFHSGDHHVKKCRGRLNGRGCPCDGTVKYVSCFGPVSVDGARFRVGDLARPVKFDATAVGVVVRVTAKRVTLEFGSEARLQNAGINLSLGRLTIGADQCVKVNLPCTYDQWDTDPDDEFLGMVLVCEVHDRAATGVVYEHNTGAEHGPCRFMQDWSYVEPEWVKR